MIRHRRLHRVVFILAAVYNPMWGLYAAFDLQWLFRFARLPLLNHPVLFACLGMVVGVYGVLYAEVARDPERGFLLAAVGLLGKILGPVGLGVLIVRGEWPLRSAILCLTNDLVWWVPFGLYLRDAWPFYRSGWQLT